MSQSVEETRPARFYPDVTSMMQSPSWQNYSWSLDNGLIARLWGSKPIEVSLYLISALRILHFRYSGVENASIVAIIGQNQSTSQLYPLPLTPDTTAQQVVEAIQVLKTVNDPAKSTLCHDNLARGYLLFRYAEADDEQADVDMGTRIDDSAMIWHWRGAGSCQIQYDTTQYRSSTVESLATNFGSVLTAVVDSLATPILEIPFPSALKQLKQLERPLIPPSYPETWPSLVEAFDQAASNFASATALVQGSSSWTYQELDSVSSSMAHEIRTRHGSSQNEYVALCIPRSALAIVAMLAIVKSGCAYVALDIMQAPNRISDILDQAGDPLVLISTETPLFLRDGSSRARIFDISDFLDGWRRRPTLRATRRPRLHNSSSLACLLFTSGTTGKPKGIRTTQKNALALLSNREIRIRQGDRVAATSNLIWDAHILEIWGGFFNGATVCCVNHFDVLDPVALERVFIDLQITVTFLPGAILRHVLAKSPQVVRALRVLFTGGDVTRHEEVDKIWAVNPNVVVVNIYGPAECCVFVTCLELEPPTKLPDVSRIALGIPLSTVQLVVLDSCGRMVPPGVIGELFIRGAHLSDGYERQKQATELVFTARLIPGVTETPCIFYRTGDKGRWNADGVLEFCGRVNLDQIKIRGQRLEVPDIETTLVRTLGIKDAGVVYHRAGGLSDGTLLGYLIPASEPQTEQESRQSESKIVGKWKGLYDESYTSDDITTLREQFIGWDSMVTGKPIPHSEMQDWLADTLRPFFDYRPKRVFEIGCGIGIILYQMIPFVEHFYAIEPSGAGVKQLQALLKQDGFANRTSIWHASADEIPSLPEFEVDFMMINSVAQYFPSLLYLKDVIIQSLDRCRPGGQIMLGDVRSAPLNDLLMIDIIMEAWKSVRSGKTVADLQERASQQQQHSTELLVDPAFFFDLQRHDSRIAHVQILPKIMACNNELSRYRYQVILHVAPEQSQSLHPESWKSPDVHDPHLDQLPGLVEDFASGSDDYLAIGQIPCRYLTWEMDVLKAISDMPSPSSTTLETLPLSDEIGRGWSAFDLAKLAKDNGILIILSAARHVESGALDAVFIKPHAQVKSQRVIFPPPRTRSLPQRLNREMESTYSRERVVHRAWEKTAAQLKTVLPSYMIPEVVYHIDRLPLTINGKLDRRLLAIIAASDVERRAQESASAKDANTEARDKNQKSRSNGSKKGEIEDTLCDLFAEILDGEPSISRTTDFFLSGGHSLLATRLVSGLKEELGVTIPVSQIFDTPTPEQLAVKVLELQTSTSNASVPIAVYKNLRAGDVVDLSFAQRRLWFLEELNPGEIWYHSGFALQFRPRLDESALQKTIATIVSRHDILRTIFFSQDGVPKSRVTDQTTPLTIIDLDPALEKPEVGFMAREYWVQPFDLTLRPPFRPILLRWGDRHVLLVCMHHIITDGFSHDIWRRELQELYLGFMRQNTADPLPPLPIQYQDYALWQTSGEQEQSIQPQLDYWIPYLQGAQPATFPKDFENAGSQDAVSGMSIFTCDSKLKEKLSRVRREGKVTWFMLLLATFRAVHFNWTGQTDVLFGTPIANRHRKELEPLLGFFVNTQAFRLRCHPGMSFRKLLNQTRESALKAYENQDVPFERLVRELRPDRSPVQNPLVEIMLAFQTVDQRPFHLDGIEAKPFGIGVASSRFDLECHWFERPGTLRCMFYYRQNVYKSTTIDSIGRRIIQLLEAVATNLDFSLGSEQAVIESVQQRLMVPTRIGRQDLDLVWEWNRDVPAASPRCIHDIISEVAQQKAETTAVEAWDGQWTYHELDQYSTKVARELIRSGIQPGDRAALLLSKSKWLPMAQLVSMKAGCVACCWDPSYPESRLQAYSHQIRPRVTLCLSKEQDLAARLAGGVVIPIDQDDHGMAEEINLPIVDPSRGLYINFTSGSTGDLKSVCITHANYSSAIAHQEKLSMYEDSTRAYAFSAISFDMTWRDMIGILTAGGCLCIPSDHEKMNELIESVQRYRANSIMLTPSMAASLPISFFKNMKTVMLGAEAVPLKLIEALTPACDLWVAYGPSECSPVSTVTRGMDAPRVDHPIGRGCGVNTWVVHPDDPNSLVAIGSIGELWLEGPLVGEGYVDSPDQTAASFIEDPSWLLAGSLEQSGRRGRVYRTGDLVRCQPDGNLVFVGRKDTQVQIRGQRVELTEIEHGINQVLERSSDANARVAVNVISSEGKSQVLAGFIVVPSGDEFTYQRVVDLLQTGLRKILPLYMVPSIWISIEKLPLQSSGKLDRQMLHQLGAVHLQQQTSTRWNDSNPISMTPESKRRLLREEWSSVLNVPLNEAFDDVPFAEFGADSILVMQMVYRCRRLGITLTVHDFFTSQTIARLAEVCTAIHVEDTKGSSDDAPAGSWSLSPVQRWFFEAQSGSLNQFNQSYLLKLKRSVPEPTIRASIDYIVRRHPMLRARFAQNEKGEWMQSVLPHQLNAYEFTSHTVNKMERLLRSARFQQNNLDIEDGPVFAADYFQVKGEQFLLLSAHHLVVDLYSWRVIWGDLERFIIDGPQAESIMSTHFWTWCALQETEVATITPVEAFPFDIPDSATGFWGPPTIRSIDQTTTSRRTLTRECSSRLLTLDVSDILVAALLYSFQQTFPERSPPPLFLEGHGREDITHPDSTSTDLSGTVGWFTSLSPVAVTVTSDSTLDAILNDVRHVRSRIPSQGRLYFASRWLSPAGRDAFSRQFPADMGVELSLNYRGGFQQLEAEEGLFEAVSVDLNPIGGHILRPSVVEASIGLLQGEMIIDFPSPRDHGAQGSDRAVAGMLLSNFGDLFHRTVAADWARPSVLIE